MTKPNDSDILAVRIDHPATGEAHFERRQQDRRTYYALVGPRLSEGSLTDAKHARESIAYWRTKGWIVSTPFHADIDAVDPYNRISERKG